MFLASIDTLNALILKGLCWQGQRA